MAGKKPARNGLLLQTLKAKLVSCEAEGPQKALPHQVAAFPAPLESVAPNAIASLRTRQLRHKAARLPASGKRTQIENLVRAPAKVPERRPRETQEH